MKLFTAWFLLHITLMLSSFANAQESGEMLLFDKKPNLKMKLTRSTLQKSAEDVLYESPISKKAANPLTGSLFNGTLANTNLTLHLSYEQDDGKWSKWLDGKMKIFENGRFWAKFDLENTSSQKIKYRFVNRGIRPPAGIEIYAVEGVYIKSIEKNGHVPQRVPKRIRYVQIDSTPKPAVVSREQWGAKPPVGNYIPHNPFQFAQFIQDFQQSWSVHSVRPRRG
ncbi:hypothetical protein GWO43_26680 [candidate division KSB1 bacterium]|nr:hypothetical protein [candidate division KSB1 bacterium]NIR70111.1 hypothetical protein [candidate division KSB1 bacterium]NIS27536.1 hypothetical protein [candidate division KSB1 bacterium]NIT74387.1 hypothetical protein [candidate division KSB1 bacterium]NIU28254.1 hypothetical protein [candidate division KSB1 bacterium]